MYEYKKMPKFMLTCLNLSSIIIAVRDKQINYIHIIPQIKIKARGKASEIMDFDRYLTTSDIARELNISQGTVWSWIKKGWLPGYKLGPRTLRIKKTDLEAFLKNGMPQKGRPKGEKKNA